MLCEEEGEERDCQSQTRQGYSWHLTVKIELGLKIAFKCESQV